MKKLFQIRFVKAFAITIFFFNQILNTAYAQEKQKSCLAPMGSLGEFSEMEKQIIFNSLQESLSTHYILASQKAFEAAQTQAFDELEYDECTEDQFFALIQQILQVDNLFLFNMTREGKLTQLSLTRVDLDSQRLVRTAFCEDCNIKQLNNNVIELVVKIFDEDQISTVAKSGSSDAGLFYSVWGNVDKAVVGINHIALLTAEPGDYDDCALTLTDSSNNRSQPLKISPFVVVRGQS